MGVRGLGVRTNTCPLFCGNPVSCVFSANCVVRLRTRSNPLSAAPGRIVVAPEYGRPARITVAATGAIGVRKINARCVLRAEGERRFVVVAGLPVHHYSAHGAVAAAYAMVFLVDAGYAT
jgi:hypothetical protein